MPKLSYWKSLALPLVLVAPLAAIGCGKTVGEAIDYIKKNRGEEKG